MKQFLLPLTLLAAVVATPGLSENQVRVRGTIEKLDGPTLVVKKNDGSELRVKPTPDATVLGIERVSIADIKPGSFIGAAAVPAANGNLRALEVHVFPENMRGTGEGHRPFDLQPKSSMTNATVVQAEATGSDNKTLTVKYKDGEQKIIVGEHTPVVTFVPGDKSDLKPGVRIIAFNATKEPDGSVEAARLGYGKNGLTPPM
jgi:hypothetical protein